MIYSKNYFILFTAIIMIAGTGCKKNNQGNGLSTETKATVTTIAGEGTGAYANGPALSAKFDSPVDVAVADDGTIYVADYNNHRIRKIAGDQVSTLAGNDTFDILNGNGELARFKNPYRIALDAGGNLYVLDQVDPRVRKISPAGYVSTYAGTDQPGFLNGATLMAQFEVNAEGIGADAQGNVYIGDTFNERIRRISTAAQVSTFTGSGSEGFTDGEPGTAQFRFPDGIACDRQGNLYVADAGNFCIRKISPAGVVTRFAGSGVRGNADGNAGVAQFNLIGDIVVDGGGNLYVTDDNRIRKVTPQGVVSTIAGSTAGYVDGDGTTAKFKDPGGLGIDAQGNIYVADINNNRIRKISFQ
ncbi:MAG: NHL repeat-containing protein [Bacteroidota bacterium]|nr:NHL repeat-containing protein [Bacteroidota bacterium]